MKISKYLAEIFGRDPLLYRLGFMTLITGFILLVPMIIDNRLVTGINPWIKPMKFCFSITVFVWTVAWFLQDLKLNYTKSAKIISRVTVITMFVEIIIILFQAFRGVPSHFNMSTPLDGILFGVMGLLIGVSTVMSIWMLLLYLFGKTSTHSTYRLGIILGFVVFLVSSWIGGQMISNNQHSVCVADGGAGVPFLNWSLEGGDLRIAHFFGLHALQVIPLVSFWIKEKLDSKLQTIAVAIFALAYLAILGFLYSQAIAGKPLISI
jgi:hypothetical protein